MRKTIVIILAVAILGGLVFTTKDQPSAHSVSPNATAAGSTTSTNTSTSSSSTTYKDGTYTGNSEETPYGTVQIAAVVSGGKITDISFLQMPSDLGHSQEVTAMSEPLLKQATLQKQSAHIDFVSGATSTSQGYQQSLQSALDQAA